MREFPIFVPFGDEHLAAVLTVPDVAPRGLVQLLQGGGGQSRSHRNRTWIRLARGLADRGIASVRMDYLGLGDSTGVPRLDVESPPVESALAVTRAALDATGADRFAIVGNCIGIPTALELAPQTPSFVGLVCIVPVALHPITQRGTQGRTATARRAAGQKMPAVRGFVRSLRRRGVIGSHPVTGLRPELATILRSGNVLILHGGTEDSWEKLRGQIARFRNELDDDQAARLMTDTLPREGPGFRELRFQQAMVDSCVDWLDDLFPGSENFPRSEVAADELAERSQAATR
jgi:pimeloyl-ACP methyl ester carboxylesterase